MHMLEPEKIILQTKLHRPRLPHDLVVRKRLGELLDHSIDLPLILVCAPAGFGKTTLVGSWLKRLAATQDGKTTSLPSAWLSLDENDSDLNLFLRYFIAALRTIFDKACEATLALLQARQQIPQAVLHATFSNELAELPGECILVLDDYHAIQSEEVHKLLSELVRHWPSPLHLVLISRISPPIPLSSVRARGMLCEIRTRDLRFTPQETADYLSQSQSALLSLNALPILEERFEGWPAGLHLAVLSLRSAGSQESVLSTLSSENANITGFLVDEVLAHQPPAVHSFLLKTSILDRFCASLCEAIIGEIDPAWNARACLEWIERSELFLTPLDDRREWYRYHHLFQELLRQKFSAKLTPDDLNNIHRRASAWFEEHGLLDKALQHALAASDLDLLARQMKAGQCDVINRLDRVTLERWLRMLPEELIQRYPGLLIARIWVLEWTWQIEQQTQVIQQIEELLDSEEGAALPVDELRILLGNIFTIKSQHAWFSNQSARALDLCQQALALLPPSWIFVRSGALLFLGLSMQASGKMLEAERLLLAEYESYSDKNDVYALVLLETLGLIYLNTGQLEQAVRIAQLLLKEATRSRITILKNWADYYLGVVHYQWNELETAEQHFRKIISNRFTAQITTYRDAVAGLALIHQFKGESAEAWQMVESISQYDLEQSGIEDDRTRSLRAHLMLLQGDLEGAGKWVDTLTDPPPDMALLWLEEPQLTRARILLARGAENDLQLALQISEVLEDITDRTHNTRFKIKVLAMRSLMLEAQGEIDEADKVLKQALDLARPGGFIRVFVDLGKPMRALLHRLETEGHLVEMVQHILAAFPGDKSDQVSRESSFQQKRHPSLGAETLVEPLTPRELEVLNMLRGAASIKEIALDLNISYATAKRHMINIYGKLGVNNRWKAVSRAEELGILPPR